MIGEKSWHGMVAQTLAAHRPAVRAEFMVGSLLLEDGGDESSGSQAPTRGHAPLATKMVLLVDANMTCYTVSFALAKVFGENFREEKSEKFFLNPLTTDRGI